MKAPPPPRTYAEWVPLIDRFGRGDDEALEAMRDGSIDWTAGVAQRWTARFHAALSLRLRDASARLQVALDRAAGNSFAVSAAMLGTRRSLRAIALATELPCLPDDVREHLAAELRRFIDGTQSSLEESAERLRHDGGALLKALRDNPLGALDTAAPAGGGAMPSNPLPAPGRRVLL